MIAVDLGKEIIIPTGVAVIGALVAGISAVVNSWFENRDARRRAERQLDLATKRTEFVKNWVAASNDLYGDDLEAISATKERASVELGEAFDEAQVAFNQARNDASTVLRQFRRLLMLVRRRNPVSYVVSALFLFVATFVWLLLVIPQPGDDSFSLPSRIFLSLTTTIALRVVAEMVVSVLERLFTSDSEAITHVMVKTDVVTITTRGDHGLSEGQTIVVDASNNKFDGTFVIATTPTPTTFTFGLRVADIRSAEVTGWVCGHTVDEQLRELLMIQGGRSRGAYVASGLFLASVLAVSMYLVTDSAGDLAADDYPRCFADLYDGSYYGADDLTLGGVDVDGNVDVEGYADFLEYRLLLVGSADPGVEIYETEFEGIWILEDDDGNEYGVDELGLFYNDSSTVLLEKGPNGRFKNISDPCDPQQLAVSTSTGAPGDEGADLLFVYFDTAARTPTNDGRTFVYASPGTGTTQIDAFYGRDGRFIPVCSATYPKITPCLDRDDVYYDPGVATTVSRAFWAGLQIIAFTIAARLLFGLVAFAFERHAARRSEPAAA